MNKFHFNPTRLAIFCLLLVPTFGYSQSQEKEVLNLLNQVRTNPQGFITSHVKDYLKENNLSNNSYAKSLMADLKKCKKMGELQLSKPLTDVARLHAQDMGKTGTVGHTSSDGTPFHERIRNQAKARGMIAENCEYGHDTAMDIVMALLIDDGIQSLGHRKNILEPKYRWIGIAIEPHKTYRSNCVMDFAESF